MSLYKLSVDQKKLDMVPEDVPSDQPYDIPNDISDVEIMTELMYAKMEMEEAWAVCSKELKLCCGIIQNKIIVTNTKPEVAKHLYVSQEDITIHTEDMSSIFVRIIQAVKEYLKKAWRWIFGYKTVLIKQFNLNSKIFNHYATWLTKFDGIMTTMISQGTPISGVINVDLMNAEKITWFSKKGWASDHPHSVIDGLQTLFPKIEDYINDPEQLNPTVLIDFEKDSNLYGIKSLLGISIVTNEKEPLSEARIKDESVNNMYDTFNGKLEDMFDLTNPMLWTGLKIDVDKLNYVLQQGIKLEEMFNSIKKSYEAAEKAINEADPSKMTYTDTIAAPSRAKVCVRAKEHIRKSQIIIEKLISICNIEMTQYKKFLDLVRKHCLVPVIV